MIIEYETVGVLLIALGLVSVATCVLAYVNWALNDRLRDEIHANKCMRNLLEVRDETIRDLLSKTEVTAEMLRERADELVGPHYEENFYG